MSLQNDDDGPIDLSANSPLHPQYSPAQSSTASASPASNSSAPTSPGKPKKKTSKPSVLPTFLPPCRVCNAKASGFHYGANTCEACKAFFRRSIGNEHTIKSCTRGRKCAENPNGKISCSDCRHKKCLAIGMAKEECRKGRYTYEKRTQDTKEIRRMQAQAYESRMVEVENCEAVIQSLVETFKSSFTDLYHYLNVKDVMRARVYELFSSNELTYPLEKPLFAPGPDSDLKEWAENFFQGMQQPGELLSNPGFQMLFEAWMTEAEIAFHGFTLFAKSLPGFSDLSLDDRILLLKQARGDTMNLIRHPLAFLDLGCVLKYNYRNDDMALIPLVYFHRILGDEFVDDLHRVTHRMQKLKLSIEDIAVFLAFLILTPDREDLQRPADVEVLQSRILPVLQYTLKKNHPDQPNIIADTLLILPMLRENAVINVRLISRIRSRLNPERFPLVCEMIKD